VLLTTVGEQDLCPERNEAELSRELILFGEAVWEAVRKFLNRSLDRI
jgi:hypothetical protein